MVIHLHSVWLLPIIALCAQAVDAAALKNGHVAEVVRDVQITQSGAAPMPAKVNAAVRDASTIETGRDSRAEIAFGDRTVVRLGDNTHLRVDSHSRSFDLAAGAYQLAVTAPDFKTYTQPTRVVANMPALAVTLSVEGITSVVTVTDKIDEPTVDASVSLDATVITGDKIDDLPDDEESLLAYLQSLAGGEGNAQLIIDGFEGGRMPTRDQIAQIIIEPNSFNANGTGPRITIRMNGQEILDADQTKIPDLKDKPAQAPAPKDKPLRGYISLQSHSGRVEFRGAG